MLRIKIPSAEYFNEKDNSFVFTEEKELQLEHSLVSISKWESKWHIPFLDKKEKTKEQTIDYVRCMCLTQNVDPEIFYRIPKNVMDQISAYIENPMTATTFSDNRKEKSREIVTSELIYYWMVSLNIPFECQKWHLNRLLTLVRVCSLKNQPSKKMSQNEIIARNRALNAERRARLKTKG